MSEETPRRATRRNGDDVYGERVRDARVIRRLKARDVADEVALSPEQYSRIENSVASRVEPMVLRRLGVVLRFPDQFFKSPPITPVERGSLLFRAKKAMTRAEEDQLVAWSRLVGDFVQGAEEHVNLPSVRVPRSSEQDDPVSAAAAMRSIIGLDASEPIGHLTRSIERCGILVASLDFASDLHAKNHDAFSAHIGRSLEWPLVVVRCVNSWERTRLSIAHELGHLVMHQVRRGGDLEREAYEFAAELLLPHEILLNEWPSVPTLMSLMPLKRKWGISLSALIEHGYRHGLLLGAQRTNMYKQLSNRRDRLSGERWRTREPGWNEREVEKPRLLAKIAETAFADAYNYDALSKLLYSWPAELVGELLEGQVQARPRGATVRHLDPPPPEDAPTNVRPLRLRREE